LGFAKKRGGRESLGPKQGGGSRQKVTGKGGGGGGPTPALNMKKNQFIENPGKRGELVGKVGCGIGGKTNPTEKKKKFTTQGNLLCTNFMGGEI